MSPVVPHQGPVVFDKNNVHGWTWFWVDEISQATEYGYGTSLATALAGRGYVEVDGKFYKKLEAPNG
jgi:hypothetical protein